MTAQDGDPEAEAPRSKRSQTVSLVLVTGAGLAALGLGALDPTQREEDVLVYADPAACTAARIRSEPDCLSDYAVARAAYPTAAPRYASTVACERHHGAGHCLDGSGVAADGAGYSLPRMAAYLIGRSAAQGLAPQPVFEHDPEGGSHGGGGHAGGFCTGSGSRIVTGSGGRSAAARVASASVRPASFGGFGGTGRGYSAAGG